MSDFRAHRLDHSVTKLVNPLVSAYLEGTGWSQSLVHFPFTLDGMDAAMAHRTDFPHRELLVKRLVAQNKGIELSEASRANIEALRTLDGFCITTGHQLCLLTGPLYFIHKIISAVRLAQQMKDRHPKRYFVPVFWMASEDHDLPEVDHFNFNGQRFSWRTAQLGAVGRMTLGGIEEVLQELQPQLGNGTLAEKIWHEVQEAYDPKHSLATATRIFVNALLGHLGVVVLDGDDVELKMAFRPIMLQEARERKSQGLIEATVGSAEWKYKVQVNPRAINLFHLQDGARERVVFNSEEKVLMGERKLTLPELLSNIEQQPEKFSPNVVMRPVYQEYILPNLAYVGGAGELAYWLELKTSFEQFGMKMPVLALRDHVLWLRRKPARKMEKLGIQAQDLFRDIDALLAEKVAEARAEDLDISREEQDILRLFKEMRAKAAKLDVTLGPSAEAEQARVTRSIKRLKKKMLRAAKRQNSDQVRMIRELFEVVHPNGSFQERHDNLLDLYSEFGPTIFEVLLRNSDPFLRSLLVLTEDQ